MDLADGIKKIIRFLHKSSALMMYKEFKLRDYFLCVTVLVIGLISFVAYASRKNAQSNISDNGVDISTPFYATEHTDNYHTNTDAGHGESTKSQTEEEDHGSEHVVQPDGTTAPVHGGNEGGKEHTEGDQKH